MVVESQRAHTQRTRGHVGNVAADQKNVDNDVGPVKASEEWSMCEGTSATEPTLKRWNWPGFKLKQL